MVDNALTTLRSPDTPRRQLALAATVLLALSLLGLGLWWLLRPDYQVLFTELRPGDAATFAAELERLKVKFRFADDDRTLQVASEDPRALRMKLMSQDLPIKGSVGFELFNNSSFGLTEFAQKVNYQRALQGELARTITSLADIESARVHLAMAESSMFRRAGNRPKASVAVAMRHGAELEAATVHGIQRLVAAAVPELEVADVTVLDARGAMAGRSAGVVSDPKLELKIEVEQYYARKILEQLEPVVGPDKVGVSVDALLNHDQARITQESSSARTTRSPRPAAAASQADAGIDTAVAPVAQPSAEAGSRRVEQIVAETGSLRRLVVALQLQGPMDAPQVERLKNFAATTAGLNPARGDAITVLLRDAPGATTAPVGPAAAVNRRPVAPPAAAPASARQPADPVARTPAVGWAVFSLALVLMAVLLSWQAQRRRSAATTLTPEQQVMLAQRLKALLPPSQRVPHGIDPN